MEPEGSLRHSQEPATCPYPEPAQSSSYPSHPTSRRPVLYLANSVATVICDPDLYRLLTFHVPKLISLFRSWGRTKESVQVRGFV
jgi:hypothetical protein